MKVETGWRIDKEGRLYVITFGSKPNHDGDDAYKVTPVTIIPTETYLEIKEALGLALECLMGDGHVDHVIENVLKEIE